MTRKTRIILFSIFGLALLARLVLWYVTRDWFQFSATAIAHTDIARNIAEGRGIVSATPTGFKPVYFYQVGYALIASVPLRIFGFEAGLFVMKLFQVLLSAGSVFIVFSLARRLFGILPGLITAFLWATLFHEAYFSVQLVPDSLMPFLVLLATDLFVRGIMSDKRVFFWWSALVTGVASVIASHPLFLPLFFFVGLLIWNRSRWRRHLITVALMMAIVFLVGLPDALRHRYEFGDSAFVRAPSIWHGLWEGFGQYPNPYGAVNIDRLTHERIVKEYGVLVSYESPEYAALLRDKSFKALRQNPEWYFFSMLPRRFVDMALIGGYGDWDLYFNDTTAVRKFIRLWLPRLFRGVIIVLAVAGAALFWRKERKKILLILCVTLYGILVHLPFIWVPRYLIQTDFPLLILSSLSLAFILRKFFKLPRESALTS